MKRVSVFILSICTMLLLSSCGKSEAAQAVDDMISAIGNVTMESDASIKKAEQAYNNLTDKEKKSVERYETLINARNQYNQAVEDYKKQCEEKIESAYVKISEFDMKGAYEIALALPDEYSEDKDKIMSKVDSMCYENTFLCKVENVVSKMPKTTEKPEPNMNGDLAIGCEYSDEDSLATASKDYYDYLNKYYTSKDSDSISEAGVIDWSNQKYVFEDEKGHTIEINTLGVSWIGSYYLLNIVIEKNVNYRDVLEKETVNE